MTIVADIPIAERTTYQSKFNVELVQDVKRVDRTFVSEEYSFLLEGFLQQNPQCFSINYNKEHYSRDIQSEITSLNSFFVEGDFNNVYEVNNLLSHKSLVNINLLMASYQKELERISIKNNENFRLIDDAFSFMCKQLYHLPFEYCAVEINGNSKLKITLKFLNDKQLMVTRNIEDVDGGWDEIRYSYFINRKLIASDVAKLEEFSKKFTEYITM